MKTLIFTYEIFPMPGGIQKYIHTLSKALGEIFSKENVGVVPFFGKYREARDYKLFLQIAHFPECLKRFTHTPLLMYAIRKVKADIIIFNHISFSKYYWFLERWKTPYTVIVYGIEVWGELDCREVEFLKNARFIISISEFTKQVLVEKGIDAEKIRILYFGIDSMKFRPIPEVRTKMGIDSKNILLTVCRLDASQRRKGYDKIIELLPELKKEIPNIEYRIVGDGTDRKRIERLAKDLGVIDKISFLGSITDENLLIEQYNICDIFIMPSEFYIGKDKVTGEGFGFVYLEAGACGKPVIAGRGGGCPESVKDGVTGFLVDPDDKKALHEAIVKVLKDKTLAEEMGRAGRKRVEQEFSYEVFVERVKKIFL